MKTLLITAAIALAAIPLTLAAIDLRGGDDVRKKLNDSGYTEVRDIEYSDGLWEAEVKRADGRWGEVHIDPKTSEVLDGRTAGTLLEASAIIQKIEAAGYSQVNDLDRDGAIWEADAVNGNGERVELRVAATDGRILNSELDYENDYND